VLRINSAQDRNSHDQRVTTPSLPDFTKGYIGARSYGVASRIKNSTLLTLNF
jgi:hypothetical protein